VLTLSTEAAKNKSVSWTKINIAVPPVPQIETAVTLCEQADILIVIGTSLNVYPAAGLTYYVPQESPIYLIDPKPVQWNSSHPFHHIMKGASEGMQELIDTHLKL
jgi:NAD-dependent deacetylase